MEIRVTADKETDRVFVVISDHPASLSPVAMTMGVGYARELAFELIEAAAEIQPISWEIEEDLKSQSDPDKE